MFLAPEGAKNIHFQLLSGGFLSSEACKVIVFLKAVILKNILKQRKKTFLSESCGLKAPVSFAELQTMRAHGLIIFVRDAWRSTT